MWKPLGAGAAVALAALSGAAARAAAAPAAPPAPSGPASGADITVTAQKRSQRLQDVPAAVTAIGGEQLARTGANSIERLIGQVPNLALGQSFGVAHLTLRGIGLANYSPGAEGSVAFHSDGVFISRPSDVFGALFDVDRIEILRGPQGTLFGRNATGGSINVVTRRPSGTIEGYAEVTIANHGRIGTQGAVSAPIVDGILAARMALQTEDRDGFGRNVATGTDLDDARQRSVRASFRFTPGDAFEADIIVEHHEENDHAYGLKFFGPAAHDRAGNVLLPIGVALGGRTVINSRDIAGDIDPRNRRNATGLVLDAQTDVGAARIRWITGYRRSRYSTVSEADSTDLAIASQMEQAERSRQFSQEVQLLGETGPLTWVGGGYYFWEETQGSFRFPVSAAIVGGPYPVVLQGFYSGGTLQTSAEAIFGQATYAFTSRFRLTLGGRYSWEKKSADEFYAFDLSAPYAPATAVEPQLRSSNSKTFRSFTPKVGVEYQPGPDLLLYATFTKGFKSGTFNLGGLQPPLEPETVASYEGGIKWSSAGGLVRTNAAGFYYDYKDLQVGKAIRNIPALENAANATIYGAELELAVRPLARLRLDGNASWLHARFDSYISADPFYPAGDGRTVDPDTGDPAFDLAGNTLPQSPRWQLSGGAEYRLPFRTGEISLRGEAAWTDRIFFTAFNRAEISQKAKTVVNAFINFTDENNRWQMVGFIRNIGNVRYKSDMYPFLLPLGGMLAGTWGEPKTYGGSIRYSF
jgi:iron complex outermembrane receptor protein